MNDREILSIESKIDTQLQSAETKRFVGMKCFCLVKLSIKGCPRS